MSVQQVFGAHVRPGRTYIAIIFVFRFKCLSFSMVVTHAIQVFYIFFSRCDEQGKQVVVAVAAGAAPPWQRREVMRCRGGH